MTQATEEPAGRVSPFVVVSDSALRLLLLAAVTVASTVYAWQYIYVVVRYQATIDGYRACASLQGDAYSRCWVEHVARPTGRGISFGVDVTLAAILGVTLVGPVVARRLQRLVEMPGSMRATLDADLVEPARALGITPPSVVLSRSPAATARVTGAGPGRVRLVAGAGMVVARETDRPAYEALLAHELAHIRNRDVQLRELVVAAWWALVLFVLVPDAVATAASGHVLSALPSLLRLAVVVVAARFIRNAVLRDRELSADVRASQVPGLLGPLTDVVGRPTTRRVWWWSSHPDGRSRLAALAQPGTMLRVSAVDLALVGATGYYLAPALRFWLQQVSGGTAASTNLSSGASWVVGAAIGLGVWTVMTRDELAGPGHSRPVRRAASATAALAVGLAVGAWIIPVPGSSFGSTHRSAAIWTAMAATTLVAAFLPTVLASLLARRLVGRAGSRRRFQVAFWAGAVAVAVSAAGLFDFGQLLIVVTSLPEVPAVGALAYAAAFSAVQHAGWLALIVVAGSSVVVLLSKGEGAASSSWWLLPDPARLPDLPGPESPAQTTPYSRSPASPRPGTM